MRMLSSCADALGSVPAARWTLALEVDVETLTSAQASSVRHGGFVAHAQRFDGLLFGISPAEASAMDPQQRLLLQLGYAAMHASLHRRVTLMGSDGGVFLGIERPDWALAQPPSARSSVFAATGRGGGMCTWEGRERCCCFFVDVVFGLTAVYIRVAVCMLFDDVAGGPTAGLWRI